MGKVLLIGGSPMIGKSTVARKISARYELENFSTDDIGEILQTASDINPMKKMNYLDYYENTDIDAQIEDLKKYHSVIETAVSKLVSIHSDWGHSMVIEGYAIYPNIDLNDNTKAIWLIASEELLLNRLNNSKAFSSASDKAKQNYLMRSVWHNKFLEKQCRIHNRKFFKINGDEAIDKVADLIIETTGVAF